MKEATSQLPIAVRESVDAIVAALELKPSGRKELLAFIDELRRPYPKLPHVSFYPVTLHGGISYRATYRIAGYAKRTERLGRQAKPAHKRAQRISEILQQIKARLMKPEEAYRLLYSDGTPVATHVAAFKASLKSSGVNPDYLASTITRLERCLDLGDFSRLSDIKRSSLPALTEKLKAFVDPAKKKVLHPSTVNQYLQSLRQFARWTKRTDRLGEDPLQYSTGIKNVEKAKRRDILLEEMGEIVATARADASTRHKMRGPDRAMLYLTAYGTGLRRKELRSLEVPWLKLDSAPPVIVVPGAHTKNGKEARQPLPAWLATEIRAWLGDRTDGKVWIAMNNRIAEAFDRDRAAARAAWIAAAPEGEERQKREQSDFLARSTVDGEMVFHSHRHAFSSQVVASMDLKSAQILTRHATAAILADTYAHGRHAKAAENVELAIANPIKQRAQAQAQSAVESHKE